MHLEMFPEAFIQLQIEIEHHPLLIQRLQKHPQIELEIIMAECCHYVGLQIDAELDGEQLEALADTLVWKLRSMSIKEALATMH